jgi:hypothetical protein
MDTSCNPLMCPPSQGIESHGVALSQWVESYGLLPLPPTGIESFVVAPSGGSNPLDWPPEWLTATPRDQSNILWEHVASLKCESMKNVG